MGTPTYVFANQSGPIPLSELDTNFTNVSTFTQSGTGAVSQTNDQKFEQAVCVLDFLDDATRTAVLANNTAGQNRTTVTTKFNDALAAAYHVFTGQGTLAVNGALVSGPTIMNEIWGAGLAGSIINSTYSGDVLHFGKAPGTTGSGVVAGGGLHSIQIQHSDPASVALRLLQTTQFKASDVDIVSTASRPNTQKGVVIDGGGGSAFQNGFDNVNVQGQDICWSFESAGAGQVTQQHFTNCYALPYSDNTVGIGWKFTGNNGQDSVWSGGNTENFKTGWKLATGAASYSDPHTQGLVVDGHRWEGADVSHPSIDCGDYSRNNMFTGYGNGFSSWVINDQPLTSGNFFYRPTLISFTPVFVSTSAVFDYSGGFQIGTAIIDGNRVEVDVSISASASGTVTNAITVTLTGLPNAISTTHYQASVDVGYCQRSGSNHISGTIAAGSNVVTLYVQPATAATPTSLGINGATGELDFTVSYFIS